VGTHLCSISSFLIWQMSESDRLRTVRTDMVRILCTKIMRSTEMLDSTADLSGEVGEAPLEWKSDTHVNHIQ
jgi:hypothetical protein